MRSAGVRFVRGCDIGPDGRAGCVSGGTDFAMQPAGGRGRDEILFRPTAQELCADRPYRRLTPCAGVTAFADATLGARAVAAPGRGGTGSS